MTEKAETWTKPPRIAIPPAGEAHVFRARFDPGVVGRVRAWLAPDEQARADRFVFEKDRRRFVFARAGLRQILGACMGVSPAEVGIRAEAGGKPFVDGAHPELQFNLAHAGDLVLYALARERRVGVDVESFDPAREHGAIAERFYSPRERAELEAAPEDARARLFLTFWTRKEAMVKATGEGIWEAFKNVDTAAPPAEIEPWTRCDLAPAPDYLGALVVEGAGVAVRRFELVVGA